MAQPSRSGTEFLVNTTTLNEQSFSEVIGLDNGRFVVTWQDLSQTGGDTSGYATRAQIFNADGTPFGEEILVNTNTSGFQLDPDIAALADGTFLVTWCDFIPRADDTSSTAVRGQIFAADGDPIGTEFLINTTTFSAQSEPAVTTLADGRFVVSWYNAINSSNGNIHAQIFNANGSKSGTEFTVNTVVTFTQSSADVVALKNGGFVITWHDTTSDLLDDSFASIRMRVYDAAGAPITGETLVNTTTANEQLYPDVTALANGRFVVTWQDRSQSGDDDFNDAVRAQIFNANGTRHGGEFVVNTATDFDQNQPTITALPDGRFVVAWRDKSESGDDTSGDAIRAQVYNANGTRHGDEFVVPTTTLGGQFDPAISALADGRFVVTWTDFSLTDPDRSNFSVRGQIYDDRTAAISLNGTAAGDDYLGTKFADSLKGGGGGDNLDGAKGNDTLTGGNGADTLTGGDGADQLRGGAGKDVLTGGNGADRFIFATASEAGTGATRDRITDFTSGQDQIDLAAFMPGGQFIGAGPFGAAGDVRYQGGILSGDVDGNGTADWQVQLSGSPAVAAGDFIF